MSLIAGALALGSEDLPDRLAEDLGSSFRRDSTTRLHEFRSPRFLLLKLDVRSLIDSGWVSTPAATGTVAGQPLLAGRGPRESDRDADLAVLMDASDDRALAAALRHSTGQFTLALFRSGQPRLVLATDRLGARPLFVRRTGNLLLFASRLRALLPAGFGEPSLQLQGVAEELALGYGLAGRTRFADVFRLEPGTMLIAAPGGLETRAYWQWENRNSSGVPGSELVAHLHSTFMGAVRRRLGTDRTTIAFLSGGLDSRCVVDALRSLGQQVYTFGFAPADSLDDVLASRFAEAVGTIHRPSGPPGWGPVKWSQLMADAIRHADFSRGAPERPGVAWGGDGGSVGMGHVYVTDDVLRHLKTGDRREAIRAHCSNLGVILPEGVFRPGVGGRLNGLVRDGLVNVLDSVQAEDPIRRFHMMLMVTDQTHHLDMHFDGIDEHRLELQSPFLDSEFVAAVTETPAEPFLRHRLYHEWLKLFSPAASAVPWQSYPGHVPCPIPPPAGLRSQWAPPADRAARSSAKWLFLGWAVTRALQPSLPTWLFSRSRIALAGIARALSVRDTSYVRSFVDRASERLGGLSPPGTGI